MRFRFLGSVIFFIAAAGCGGGGYSSSSSTPAAPSTTTSSSAPAGAATVSIVGQRNDQSFAPNPVPITQGALVVWHNGDSTVHRIVMNDGSFDSGNLAPGADSAAMRLSSAGGQYHCLIHPTTMFGSINVTTDPMPAPGSAY